MNNGGWLVCGIQALRPRFHLTRAEALVCRHVVRGKSNKEVAIVLGIATSTARTHLLSTCRKVGVASRGELAFAVFCESVALLERGEVAPGSPARAQPTTRDHPRAAMG